MRLKRNGFARSYTLIIALALIMSLILAACSDKAAEDAEQAEEQVLGWEYFETFNPIGSTYGRIAEEHESLDEEGTYDGGVVLKVDGNDRLFYGFPKLSKDALEDGDLCTSVYGDMETIFGIDYYIDPIDFEELLGAKLEADYDGLYIASKTAESGNYLIRFELTNTDENISPEIGVTVFSN